MPINDGSIIVSFKGDTSDIEQKISELQKKLRSLREGGALGQLAQQYRSRGMEDRANQLDQFRQREQVRNRRELEQSFRNQEKSLDSLKRHYDNIQKGLDSMVKGTDAWKQKSTEAAEVWDKIVGKAAQVKATYQELFQGNGAGLPGLPMQFQQGFGPFSARDLTHIARSGQMGGFGGGMRGMGRVMMRNPALMAGMGMGGLGAIGAGMGFYGQAQLQLGTFGERVNTAKARSVQNLLGEAAQLREQGRSYELELFGEEKLKALDAAQNRMAKERTVDKMGLGTTVLGAGVTAGGYMAAKAAPLLAAPVPGARLAYGALVGTAALGGAAVGFGGAMMSDRKRSMLFDEEGYNELIGSIGSETYQEQRKALEAKNFELINANKFFERRRGKMLQTQRALGLSDEELFGGEESLYKRASRAGFTGDIIEGQAQQILQAGGTTGVAGGQGGIYAAQMARGLDLTNAGQLMGMMSGGRNLNADQSKDAIIRMFAEATRIGLDTSETRTFMESATQMAYQTGGDSDAIAQMMGGGLGQLPTGRGIQAATNAMNRIRGRTGEMGGLSGQYGMAELQSDEINKLLGEKLDMGEMAYILGTDVSKISGNKAIMGFLQKRGINPASDEGKQLMDLFRKANLTKTFTTDERKEAIQDVDKKLKVLNSTGYVDIVGRKEAEKQYNISLGKASALGAVEEGTAFTAQDLPEQEQEIGIMGTILSPSGLPMPAPTTGIEKKLEEATGAANKRITKSAEDFGRSVDNLNKKMTELIGSFQSAVDSKAITDLLQKMEDIAIETGNTTEAFKIYKDTLKQILQSGGGGGTTPKQSDVDINKYMFDGILPAESD
jgi:hypothetical protein